MNPPARSRAPGSGLGLWLGWVLVMVWVAGPVAAAVSSSMGEKLRAAIRLPEVQLQAQFSASQVQDWHGDDDLPDPQWEAERLRQTLTGHPTSTVLRVAEFALRLKRGDFSGQEQPGELLEAIGRGLEAMPEGEVRASLHRRLFITLVIANVLEGEVKVARQRLRQFLSQVPDDDYALEVDRLVRELPDSD